MFEVSYSPVEAALVRTYGVRKLDIARFRARITFLQKGGLLGVSPGKGKALRYSPDLIHRLLFAVELAEHGITPAQTLTTISDLWESRIRRIFADAERAAMAPPGDDDIVMVLCGHSLMVGAWTSTAKALPNVNGFPLRKLNDNLSLLLRYDNPPPRAVVVNLSAQLRKFHDALVHYHLQIEPPVEATRSRKSKQK